MNIGDHVVNLWGESPLPQGIITRIDEGGTVVVRYDDDDEGAELAGVAGREVTEVACCLAVCNVTTGGGA